MNYWAALEVLGLEDEGLTREHVRRTYMRRLRAHPPERDPEGFRRLREAFEALREIVPERSEPESEQAEVAPSHADSEHNLWNEIAPAPPADTTEENPRSTTEAAEPETAPPSTARAERPEPVVPHSAGARAASPASSAAPSIARGVAFSNAPTTLSLEEVVQRILMLLQHDEVYEAIELHTRWQAEPAADDHLAVSDALTMRWALTRELLGVAQRLPNQVVVVLARGIAADNLAAARSELSRVRLTIPYEAAQAEGTLRQHAKDIYRVVQGALYVEPAPSPYYAPAPQPNYSSPHLNGGISAGRAIWIVLIVIIAIVRCATMSSRHSSGSYTPRIPEFNVPNLDRLRELSRTPDLSGGSNRAYAWDEPPPFDPNTPPELLWGEAQLSALAVQIEDSSYPRNPESPSLRRAVEMRDCAKIRKALDALDAPSDRALRHVAAIRDRLTILCAADQPDKKPGEKSKKKSKAKKPPPE